jgi:hypothetical protein
MKLYKVTIEHSFAVMDEDDSDCLSVEASIDDILYLHDIFSEPITHVLAEEIKTIEDINMLPEGWCPTTLPYSRFHHIDRPDLTNLSVKDVLEPKSKPPVTELNQKETYVVRTLRGDEKTHAEYLEKHSSLEQAIAELQDILNTEKRLYPSSKVSGYVVKQKSTIAEELVSEKHYNP